MVIAIVSRATEEIILLQPNAERVLLIENVVEISVW